MDPIKSFLGRELLEEITPVVMVLSTPKAEDSCSRNGLSLVDMLHAFSLVRNINVPVRTASDQPYRLQVFKLRLVYASDVRQRNQEAANERLKQVVGDASERMLPDLRSDPPQLGTVLSKSESDFCPSWIQTFNKELMHTVSFSEHEAFDHPVACLLVVSSKDDQPINKFVDLFNTDQLPSLLNEGAMDPKIMKHYLLLHDNQYGTLEKAAGILAEMRSTFGSNDCKLLCINSAQGEDDRLKDNPWTRNKIRSSTSQEIALQLNKDDVTGIKDFMQDLSSKHIIPHMEHKIRILNQQVSATRKGFRNQIKNLWWRKGKEDMPEAQNGSTYTFSSIESQIRVLGDYAFMLRDYELALSNYRLLSTDYKLDKAWKRYAGIQEMMGLSFFMLDQSRKESEYCMEAAFTTYLKLGLAGQRNATRCGLWWADILKARGQHKDAASIYFRISNEEPTLHAAVILEQASYCYLLSKPPMLRKYGFHLVLAGNCYNRSNQKQHAIRMYRNALAVYKGHDWNYIRDHVHFSIGRWYSLLGISDVAIKHMLEVLVCSHQSLTTQDLFLREFFHAVEKMGTTFEVNKLQLPVINMSSYKVIYEDHRTYSSSADVSVSESLWHSLEEEMVPSKSNVRSNWLDSQSKVSPSKKYNDSCVCVLGEAIKLDIEFQNPLQIPISISGMSLICELSANSEETKSDRTGLQDDEPGELPSCRNLNNDSSSLTSPEFDLVLGGGETKRVQLEVTPKVEGILKVIGVRWKLSGLVGGCRYFEFDAKKKPKWGKREPKQSLTNNLNFIVIKGLPKLEGCIKDLPGKAYAGDLRLLKLELRNQSEYSVKNMKLKISDPRFLIPGSLEDLNKQFPSPDAIVKSGNTGISANVMEKPNSSLFSFPNDTIVHGGTTFVWPLWFHTGHSGNITIYLSIYYEMEGCSSDMIYRTLRMHYDVEVLPSLEVSLLISPSPSRLQDFLVRMDILNKTNSECFSLQQLSCVGNQWEIASLPTKLSICPSQSLLAGQALSCFFMLKHCMGGSVDESKLTVKGRDVSLSTKENKEELIDISLSPLADFHHQERYHQRKSVEVSRNTIDFILISKTKEDDANLEPGAPSKLLSYHMCNCSSNSKSPIWWAVDGPRTLLHDFSSSFCEVTLHVMIQNCFKVVTSIRITTFDGLPETNHSSNAVKGLESDGYQEGWHDVPSVNDIKVISDAQGVRPKKSSSQSVSPFIWCASSTTQVKLGPECTTTVPLRICMFSPGTYDLSNYELHWKQQSSEGELADDLKELTSGMIRGHPFYLTAVQSPPATLE
ncbi:trafficking protein particle complex subunit 8-like [Iris pallida]|uniref:Trafficking protein particle complex subunit 8-like n=1 Tax=Iris pallida TaxID=29817 RepID=A0AAX6DFW0_IRIPA|nr:trafficking protein particle complex subunit 8-like [Iris pallida]